jgi:integrase
MTIIRKTFPRVRTYILRGRSRFEVDARKNGGGRRFYFSNRSDALAMAKELASVSSEPVITKRTDGDGHDRKLLERILQLLERQVPTQPTTTTEKPLPRLLDEWVEARRNDKFKPLRPRSFQSIRVVCIRFKKLFGKCSINEINRERIETVFTRQNWSSQSLRNYRSYLSQFFNWLIRRGFTTDNPLKYLQVSVVNHNVEVYSIDQVTQILSNLQREEFVLLTPYIAIGLFAGIRPIEIERTTWENNIRLGTDEIEIQAGISKTKRSRRFVLEPILKSWLMWFKVNHESDPIIASNFRRRLDSFKKVLPFKWIPDGLRHTFGTYHYNRTKNIGELTFIMGNSEAVAKRHYITTIPQKDVGRFWNLYPDDFNSVKQTVSS